MASTEFDRSLDDIIKQNKKGPKNNKSPGKGKQQQQQQQGNKSPQKNGRKIKINRNGLYSNQMNNSSPKKGQGNFVSLFCFLVLYPCFVLFFLQPCSITCPRHCEFDGIFCAVMAANF